MAKSSLVFLLLAISSPVISSAIEVTDGGYTGIVVKISDEVPEDACEDILKRIQETFNEASRVLFDALDEKLYFKEVIVVVPKNWRDSRCQKQIQTPRGASVYRDIDIHVGLDHPVHRSTPFTQQSRGCGHSGDFISIPHHFFTNWNQTLQVYGNPFKVFVHEWAKYRYGVFDEFGYAGDKLYPSYYKINDQLVPTGASDMQVKGSWMTHDLVTSCDPKDGSLDCYFVADQDANDQVTCSLGYMPFLPNVNRFCSLNEQWGVKQGSLPPTKHNVLCQAQGSKEVIAYHPDMLGSKQVIELPPVNIKVVKDVPTKYVLVIESSSSMLKKDLWKWVSKAAQKFIRLDLQANVKVAVVTFSDEAKVQHSLAPLSSEEVRARIADSIPDKYKVASSPDERCVFCGLKTAIEQVLDGDEAGAHIILVTRGENDSLGLSHEETILKYVRDFQIKFSNILVPNGQNPVLAFYDKFSSLSGGRSFVFQNTNAGHGAGLFRSMIEAFYGLQTLDTDFASQIPVTVLAQVENRQAPDLKSTGTFAIDSTLGHGTLFGIIVNDPDDHNIKSVTFTDNHGEKYGPYSSLSSDFTFINMMTINFLKDSTAAAPPFDDYSHIGLNWKYEVNWWDEGDRSIENVIVVESKPKNVGAMGLIEVQMWTTSEATTDLVTSQHPLKLFVQVTKSSSPVMEARVRVMTTITLNNGTTGSLEPIDLWDNGNGDPDIMAGDGVYSRYLIFYPAMGRYSFTAHVDDNEGKAYTVQVGRQGRAMKARPQDPGLNPVCCGSEVTVPAEFRRPTGSFKRTLNSGPVVHLLEVPSYNSDKMPPSRISDLVLEADESGGKLVASWTAPGDDFDHGSVSKYTFIFSEYIVDLLDTASQPPILHQFERPDKAGSKATYSFTFNKYDKDYHVALYGLDEAGNRANISNIVLVRLPQPSSTEDPPGPTEGPVGPQDTDWVMVGIVSGVVLTLLILMLVGLYIYFCVMRNRRKSRPRSRSSAGVNVDLPGHVTSGAGSDNSSFDEAKNSSSNHLVPQISTISNVYKSQPINQSSTSFANGITPTYWSASQLLKEHEERKMRENAQLQNIAEENAGYDYHTDYYGNYYDYNPADYFNYYNNAQQRLSQTSAEFVHQSGGVDYHPNAEQALSAEQMLRINNNKLTPLSKASGNSDNSSSGTIANNSLQGSLISVNSGRPPSSVSKTTRNITQV